MNNRFMKSYERMDGSFSTTVVVDSLPTENIKPNVIYAVKKIDYYTSFYGLHISPLTSMSDVNTSVLADLMQQNGWKSGEITEQLFQGILIMGMLPQNLSKLGNLEGQFINEYNDNLFKLKILTTGTITIDNPIDKSFEKLDDLYQYLFSDEYANTIGELFVQLFTSTQTKLREHNFVWSEQALPDYQLGVVFTPTYEYYIYNGEEWKNVDDQIVVKQINSLQGTITFTEEETLKLAQGAKLYALPYSYGSPTFIDCIEIGRQSEIKDGKANIWAYYKIGLAFDPDGTTYTEYLIKIITSSTGTKGSVYCQLGTRLKFWRDDISSDGWKEVTDVPGYKYGYFVEQWGVQAKSIVEVYFEIADAASGNFAPFVNTNPDSSISSGDYGFVIYAKEKPTGMMSFSYDVEF